MILSNDCVTDFTLTIYIITIKGTHCVFVILPSDYVNDSGSFHWFTRHALQRTRYLSSIFYVFLESYLKTYDSAMGHTLKKIIKDIQNFLTIWTLLKLYAINPGVQGPDVGYFLHAIAYVADDGVRHLESPVTYNRSSFRCKWWSYPWRNLRQVRRCRRICYAILQAAQRIKWTCCEKHVCCI